MFYKNVAILKTALMLMLNNVDNIQLMNNIDKCFREVKLDDVHDIETKKLVELIQTISNDIQSKGLRTVEAMKIYIANSSLSDDIKKLILSLNIRSTDKLVKSYNYYFTKMTYAPELEEKLERLITSFDKFKKSGVEAIDNSLDELLTNVSSCEETFKNISRAVSTQDMFILDVSSDTAQSFGMDKLEQSITNTQHSLVKTGMWIDNLTGGGFRNSSLYLAAAVGGGFKSGFLQNIVEYMSCTMKPKDFDVPSGLTPVIYYLNLEMNGYQMFDRKMSFYDTSMEDISVQVDQTKRTIEDLAKDVLKAHGSILPVVYEQGEPDYKIRDIKIKLNEAERNGYYVVCLVVDYIDLIKYEQSVLDERERKEPIVVKAEGLRALAKEFKIPVITAAQLNRNAEDELKTYAYKANSEDLVLRTSSSQLAKAYALKTIPEQIYMCYKFDVGDRAYFSIVVDKDRDGKAKFIPCPELNKDKKENKDGTTYKRSRPQTRVIYVAPLENPTSIRISKKYSNTIRDFEDTVDDDKIFAAMEVTDDTLDSQNNIENNN